LPLRAYHLALDCSVGTLEKIIALPFRGCALVVFPVPQA
jgi:hypothetical protein